MLLLAFGKFCLLVCEEFPKNLLVSRTPCHQVWSHMNLLGDTIYSPAVFAQFCLTISTVLEALLEVFQAYQLHGISPQY